MGFPLPFWATVLPLRAWTYFSLYSSGIFFNAIWAHCPSTFSLCTTTKSLAPSSLNLPIKIAEQRNTGCPQSQPEQTQLSQSPTTTCAPTPSSQQPYDGLTPAQHCTQYSRGGPTRDEHRGLIAFLDLPKALPNEIPQLLQGCVADSQPTCSHPAYE